MAKKTKVRPIEFGDTYYIPGDPPSKRIWRGTEIDEQFHEMGQVFRNPHAAQAKYYQLRNNT